MRPADFGQVLLAFLRAELDSPTERSRVLAALSRRGLAEATLSDGAPETSALWRLFLDYRGRERLFDGLDLSCLTWFWFDLTLEQLKSTTLTCRHHFESAYGTRNPATVASVWDREHRDNGVVKKILDGRVLEPPILIGDDRLSKLVILECHNRLISYLRGRSLVQFPIRAIVGTSPRVSDWCQW
jgi:hypothetical protein